MVILHQLGQCVLLLSGMRTPCLTCQEMCTEVTLTWTKVLSYYF